MFSIFLRFPFLVRGRLFASVLVLSAVVAFLSLPLPAGEDAIPAAWIAPLSDGAPPELPELDPAIPSPAAFFGEPLGTRFHRHEEILAYLEALVDASERVTMWEYGRTYEGRPLRLLAISSPDNIQRLEEIRLKHRRLASPAPVASVEREALAATQPAFVWLAYGVHGNETSSSEAAMATAHVLAAATAGWEERLREVVVLLDPLSNPDGRERYLSSFLSRRGREPNPDPRSLEHFEPWPGGRFNHYLIDLNRDWAWATQQETRHRLEAYRSWEPQIYVDLHEMSSDSTYFFPPPADPVHPAIGRRVLRWLETFGQGNANSFNEMGWLFYNRQQYDLFYPGYGDSYPSLRGAVGMTYEVAGGGKAGQVLRLKDGSLWTLADRLARHLVSSLTTVETAAANRVALLQDFMQGRLAASTRLSQSLIWDPDQPEARSLAELLALHGVEVGQLTADVEMAARPGIGGSEARHRFPTGSYTVSTAQPLSHLVDALMNVDSPLSPEFVERQRRRVEANLSAEFYDITAWALPLAYGVETWVVYGEPPAQRKMGAAAGSLRGPGGLGWAIPPQGLATYRLGAALSRWGVRHRLALTSFEADGRSFPRGTLLLLRRGNPEDLPRRLEKWASDEGMIVLGVGVSTLGTGLAPGSNDLVAVRPVSVGLATGEGLSPTSVGHLWHLLDQSVGLPHRQINLQELASAPASGRESVLADLDVLILPDGRGYEAAFGEKGAETLRQWVEAGGSVVGVGEASSWLVDIGLYEEGTTSPAAGSRDTDMRSGSPGSRGWSDGRMANVFDGELGALHDALDEELSEDILGLDDDLPESRAPGPPLSPMLDVPGAALSTKMSELHPLTAGIAAPPAALVQGRRILRPSGLPDQDVLTVALDRPVLSGFAWPEAEEQLAGSLLVGSQDRGRGRVIVFAQDPAFRLFWRSTMPLFLNAVMYSPSW